MFSKRRLMQSTAVGVSAVLLLTGVSLATLPASAEEISSPSPTASEAPTPGSSTPAPTPTETIVPEPSATESATPTPAETEPTEATPSPAPSTESTPEPATEAPGARLLAAASIGTFDAGNIISDFNFYNSWAMTESEIQAFLDAKCTGINCLNTSRFDTPTKTWSWGTCSTYNGGANESAAAIIYKVQRACSISAKVILVTLQKEQGLVTRTSPSAAILQKAMGYGCPDTSDCDANFYGFFNQVFAAARQLAWYSNPGGSFTTIKVGQVNAVRYHPNADCGAGNVLITNKATAALYYYTPYQPNAAALAAGYAASPDACASYGNRNFFNYYRDWFGNPTVTSTLSVQRLAGDDRYATAVAISRSTYPNGGVPVVYVTTGENFPDALSAAPAAASQGGPILLTNPSFAPSSTLAELARLNPARVIVVGGTVAVSDAAFNSLKAIQPNITRISGSDRYETSRLVAQAVFPNATSAYVATGLNYPDALSASAAAGSKNVPVILLDGAATVNSAIAASLAKITSVKVAGGPVAVSDSMVASINALGISSVRLYGSDRYQTSVAINRDAFATASTMYLAVGLAFPDALSGAAAAGALDSPLYVTMPGCVSNELRADVNSRSISALKLIGGPNALNDNVALLATC